MMAAMSLRAVFTGNICQRETYVKDWNGCARKKKQAVLRSAGLFGNQFFRLWRRIKDIEKVYQKPDPGCRQQETIGFYHVRAEVFAAEYIAHVNR